MGQILGSFIKWALVAFMLVFVIATVAAYAGPFLPFLGLRAGTAERMAQNHVDTLYPEFSNAERTVSAVYMDGTPVYVVDFVLGGPPHGPAGLRVLVDRDLQHIWPAQYISGR